MKLFDREWTPESADQWTIHDVIASVLSAFTFVAVALGGAWAAVADARGYFLLAAALGASLLLWATIDAKLRAQSVAFRQREAQHKKTVESRQRWEE